MVLIQWMVAENDGVGNMNLKVERPIKLITRIHAGSSDKDS